MPKVEAAVRSNRGRVRENNEDNFYMNGIYMEMKDVNESVLYNAQSGERHQLYAVCDGMGGLALGELAAYITVSDIDVLRGVTTKCFPAALDVYAERCSREMQSRTESGKGSGCTLAAVYIYGNKALVAHTGDSRVYFKRKRKPLRLLTQDHSQAFWYVSQGIMTPEEAQTHPSRNMLRRYIGAPTTVGQLIEYEKVIRLRRGDIFVLCSDGLTDMVDINEIDANTYCGFDTCRRLTTLALERGGYDNITVMTLTIH
jgi:protein phosphatase